MAHIIFDPSQYTAPNAKPMPVILILDNSGSMWGEKIDNLNQAVREMLEAFQKSECMDAAFTVAIVTFGTGIHLLQEMMDVSSIHWQDIPISDIAACKHFSGKWDNAMARGTPLAQTLDIVKKMIEDKTIVPSRAYRPAIILVSDGHPTESWKDSLRSFIEEGRSSKCDRWAMAIGRDADTNVLQNFIKGCKGIDGRPKKLLYAKDAQTLRDNFKFITMSVTNTVAIASKSKVLTVQPVTVQANELDEDPPVLMKRPKSVEEEGTGDDIEW